MRVFLKATFLASLIAIYSGFAVGASTAGIGSKEDVQKFRWKSKSIEIAISRSLTSQNTNIKSGSDVAGAIRRSIASWQDVASIEIVTTESGKTDVSPAGPSGDGVSLITIAQTPENLLFFGRDPYSVSARTRIFYNRRGIITEADIVLNPFQQFSTDGSYGTFDLESTLRHEIGHLLGLRHSKVVGATMYDSALKNGDNGLQYQIGRLSDDDIASIRAIYGSSQPNEECCGSIVGKISSTSRSGREFLVWAQDSFSGRIVSSTTTDRLKGFRLDGLIVGKYSVYAIESGVMPGFSRQRLEDVIVEKGSTASLNSRYSRKPVGFSLELLGMNGLLSDSSITLERGSSYILLAGGKNISSDRVRIVCDSPFLSVERESIENVTFDANLSAVSFRIVVDNETPPGQYNILAISDNDSADIRVGALTVAAE